MPRESGTRPSSARVRTESTASVPRLTSSRGRRRTRAFITRLGSPGPDRPAARDRICGSMRGRLLALAAFLTAGGALLAVGAPAAKPLVVVGRIDTPIHPAAANYLSKLVRGAERDGAGLIVLGISTPGGLLTSTREMTTTILQSKVPVATFVSPSGASAAS